MMLTWTGPANLKHWTHTHAYSCADTQWLVYNTTLRCYPDPPQQLHYSRATNTVASAPANEAPAARAAMMLVVLGLSSLKP